MKTEESKLEAQQEQLDIPVVSKRFFQNMANECIEHLTATNPSGGIKEFIRIAVEFDYKRAAIPKKLFINISDFLIGLVVGILGAIIVIALIL